MRNKLLSTLALATAGWLSLADARAKIVVGVIQSQTGPVSSIGLPYVRGIQAGQAYIGEAGGEKFRIIVLDDASDPSTAAKTLRAAGRGGRPPPARHARLAWQDRAGALTFQPQGL